MSRASEPLTLRVRNAEDLAAQLAYHQAQAIAQSLIQSTMLQALRPPQSVPYKTATVNASGSDLAGRYSMTAEAYILNHQHYLSTEPLDWERQAKLDEQRDALQEKMRLLDRELSCIPAPSRGHSGTPGRYAVTVPALRYGGGVEGERAEGRYGLEVDTLPSALRVQVAAFLWSGSEAMPYCYRPTKSRYESRHSTPALDREMYRALIGYLFTL